MTYSMAHSDIISLWDKTAKPAPETTLLTESYQTDVAIIGAGYTGLSTALHLAKAGTKASVIESKTIGWGASGRNGGQVIPGLKYDPSQLISKFGVKQGERLIDLGRKTADIVFDLIDEYNIECEATRTGWIQPAHSHAAIEALKNRSKEWQDRGENVEFLDKSAVTRYIGSDVYVGGWIDKRAGNIQPLSYSRGLARAALSHGVTIHENSPVVQLEKMGKQWRVITESGAIITANHVVIATNGYSDNLWPQLRQTLISANSFILATKPISEELGKEIIPNRQSVSDSRRLMFYYRKDDAGRLLMGGRGSFTNPTKRQDFAHLKQTVSILFPQLKSIEYEYSWSGRVAMTRDFMPHLHEPDSGLTIMVGYNGRGVAMASTMGCLMAERLLKGRDRPFPLPVSTIQPIPFHGMQRFYISAAVAYYSLLDRLF